MIGRVSASALIWLASAAYGAAETSDGDTHIFVYYVTKSVRVRPSTRIGETAVDYEIVLHPNGKVEDAWGEKGGRKGETDVKLGGNLGEGQAVYRVIDTNTIVRRGDVGNYIFQLTVNVGGKNCSVKVEYLLKPGEQEYRSYSNELKQMAYFSSIEMAYSTCVIK